MKHTVMLKKSKDFSVVYRRGQRVSLPGVLLYVRRTGRAYNRLGLAVGKKIGCAVERNRAKRILRAAYTLTEERFPVGVDMVAVALPQINGRKSTDLVAALEQGGLRRIEAALAAQVKAGKGGRAKPAGQARPDGQTEPDGQTRADADKTGANG